MQFTFFSAAVLYLWLGDASIQSSVRDLPTIPGAVELLCIIIVLMVASLALGGWLTVRNKVNKVILIASVLLAALAIWWNILAVAFWLAPVLFLWMAYRSKNDGQPCTQAGLRKSAQPLSSTLGLSKSTMTENLTHKKQETLGRWGLAITAFMLVIFAIVLFFSNASLWLVGSLFISGLGLLWLALAASAKVAVKLGNFFPLGF